MSAENECWLAVEGNTGAGRQDFCAGCGWIDPEHNPGCQPGSANDRWGCPRLRRSHLRPIPPGLLDDYDPVPGLLARGVVSDEHDPDSCEAVCCIPPAASEEQR